ncbi:MscS Mechanosensitive ion channel [Gloeothece citriformis PCC 7424]|uniref:MscS Mechanosensitive ion channel n=1 Tax=Gloeothece citriformis (strain PCC 7424) TaxID=65393 RepID=B7K944_GLOC7|nr:mechanosensitive ion channel domain-containing protein [Gloeothece citriformis]ACK72813.1 MscS Mechanosensitive ion channel [Gloeothece citriformis PCC 7424]
MKKILKTLIISFFISCFLVITVPVVVAQKSPSPQGSPSPNQPQSAPIILGDKTLFLIQAPQSGLSVPRRAQVINRDLEKFANDQALPLEDLEIYEGDNDGIPLTSINAGNIVLMKVSNQDAEIAGKPRGKLAQEYFEKIQVALIRYRQERSTEYLLWATFRSFIATVILLIVFIIINNIFARIYQKLKAWEETYIRAVRLGNLELIRANQLDNIITGLIRVIHGAIILLLLLAYLTFVLKQFPWTRRLAKIFQGYLAETLSRGWQAFVDYGPNLLTIILVTIVTYFILRLTKPFFQQLGEGSISLPGFYPEWAEPTYRLVSFLIIALAAVVAFPFLPGFESPAFQGITVFLGILFSLGSSSVVSNLVSGSVLIYTRAFRMGDHVKIGSTYGKVLEKTLLVTRVLTPQNVVVSIPNAQISTSAIENYSFAYRDLNKPYILKTSVYLGYEVSWQEAYIALREAAKQTKGMLSSPEPFILQEQLNEVYVTYIVNVYVDEAYFQDKTLREYEQARSQLHENIRNCCIKAGITIFAPRYEADPTKYGPVKD